MTLLKRSETYTKVPLLLLLLLVLYNLIPRSPGFAEADDTPLEHEMVSFVRAGASPRMAVAFMREGYLYATEDHFIYRKDPGKSSFEQLGHFSKVDADLLERGKDLIARMEFTRSIRKKFGANNVIVLDSGTILVFYDHVFRSDDAGRSFEPVLAIESADIFSPFLHGLTVDADDRVYFGEYTAGQRPLRPRIYMGAEDGRDWSVFHEFPSGQVYHVHAVKYDSYRDRLWVTTGDRNEESYLMYFDAGGNGPFVVGGGDQGWRIISLIPTEDALIWCSDNDQTGSNVYRYDFETETRERVQFIGSPCYDSIRLADGTMILSTTFEADSDYARDNKIEPATEIWASSDGSRFHRIFSLAGRVGDPIFGRHARPRILFPQGDQSSDYLYFTPLHTQDFEFTIQKYKLSWAAAPPPAGSVIAGITGPAGVLEPGTR